MRTKLKARLFSGLMALAVALSLTPGAFAAEGDVAQIGDKTYATLGEAIAAANASTEPVTIEVLQSCNLDKAIAIAAEKNVTITAQEGAGITITDNTRKGMTLSTNTTLTVENLTFDTNSQIYLNGKGGTLTFKNVNLTMDGEMYQFNNSGYYCCAIAIEQSESSLTFDNCDVYIENYPSSGSAIRWNGSGTDSGYNVSILNGTTLTSTNCYSGFVGTCDIKIYDSTVNVLSHRGNGSNGSYYDIRRSTVNFTGNGSHGISAGGITISDHSTVISDSNGLYGIYAENIFSVDGTSTVTVTKNSAKGDYAGLKIRPNVKNGLVEKGAVVTITDNYCSGLSNNGVLTFEEGAKLTIMNNVNDKGSSSHGGGIYNSGESANLTLPSGAVIYNNHALTDGDDIYNSGTIKFGQVGSDWALDGDEGDCEHLIDGWYDDSAEARWEAHAETEEDNHIEEFTDFDETSGLATITDLKALKAAHGENAQDKTDYPALDKQVKDNNATGDDWSKDTVSAEDGETLSFKLSSNVPKDLWNYIDAEKPDAPSVVEVDQLSVVEGRGSYDLTFHDKLNSNLTFDASSVKVTLGDTTLTRDEDYNVTTENLGDNCTFEISLDLAKLYEAGKIEAGDIDKTASIVVTYDATLNKGVANGKFPNEAWVTYEGEPGESSHDKVFVETYAINIFKYDQSNKDTGLEGATFELYQKDGEGSVIETSKVTLTSGPDGIAKADGLDAGTYYLKETKAPEGYVGSDKEVEVVIPEKAGTDNIANVKFANSPVPHTGGMGTAMFTVGGAAILAAAGALFVTTRRERDF